MTQFLRSQNGVKVARESRFEQLRKELRPGSIYVNEPTVPSPKSSLDVLRGIESPLHTLQNSIESPLHTLQNIERCSALQDAQEQLLIMQEILREKNQIIASQNSIIAKVKEDLPKVQEQVKKQKEALYHKDEEIFFLRKKLDTLALAVANGPEWTCADGVTRDDTDDNICTGGNCLSPPLTRMSEDSSTSSLKSLPPAAHRRDDMIPPARKVAPKVRGKVKATTMQGAASATDLLSFAANDVPLSSNKMKASANATELLSHEVVNARSKAKTMKRTASAAELHSLQAFDVRQVKARTLARQVSDSPASVASANGLHTKVKFTNLVKFWSSQAFA